MSNIAHLDLGNFPLLLAPMEGITDAPFRQICRQNGADMVFTEFISSEGLVRDAAKSLRKFDFAESERPIGIQIFGHDVDSMRRAAEMAEEAHPDVIDLNFGCPVRKVTGKGGGAALLLDIPKMCQMTEAVVKSTNIPVTAKTRLGWDEKNINIPEVAERLQDAGIQALSIHGRTRAQLYGGTADWTLIGEVKNNPRIIIPIIGNGDIDFPEKALEYKKRYNVDGIMIGRGAKGNPWLFKQIKTFAKNGNLIPLPETDERVRLCREHLSMNISLKGERYGLLEMRKFYGGYFKGIPDFKPYRMKLMEITEPDQLQKLFDEILLLKT